MTQYFYDFTNNDVRKYYSLNFLFAKFKKVNFTDIPHRENEQSVKHKNKDLAVGNFYKFTSTIFFNE